MEFLKGLGIAGFLFFLIKGLLWLLLFALVYFGVIDKKKLKSIMGKISFWKKKSKD
ncbi:MAG: hypothetical protein AAGC47_08645 [Bacteroidota bacterium]